MKKALKKIWYFIWEDDSIWSWIVNIVLAFVIIKFLVYPGLGFALGTPAPIVAVVSGSMEHDGSFDDWWMGKTCCNEECSKATIQSNYYSNLNISRDQFRDFSFVNGFNKGDIMILVRPEKAGVGDVLVYQVDHRPDPIIHRIVDVTEKNGKKYYDTKGDNNCGMANFEFNIPQDRAIGKAVWRVPFLGWVKIVFVWLVQLFV